MALKKIGIFLILIFFITPFQGIFAQVPNVGFIPANIWYSKDPFQEGDKIKVYTLVYNPAERELSCTVIFFDNTTLLGTKNITISAKSVKDTSIDWTVTSGDHVIFAKIENAKFLISKDKYEEVYLAENKTEESKRSVSKKIITDLPDTIVNKITNVVPVSDVKKIIENNTPVFVSKAIESTTNSLEKIRTSTENSLLSTKENIQKEIDILNKNKINTDGDLSLDSVKSATIKEKLKSPEISNNIIKPFKYVELFFLGILSFIFKTKILFYGILILISFLIIRFIWNLIF